MEWRIVTVFVVWLGFTSASIIEINETTFRSFPPLYALDEWSECQAPGDVYCIVDAALISKQPSPLLTLLQEYSKQTLKHYNRTLIHRGVCVSRCGSMNNGSWDIAAQRCVNPTLQKYGLEAEVESVAWCSSRKARRARGAAVGAAGAAVAVGAVGAAGAAGAAGASRALVALSTLAVALAGLATALHALGKTDGNKYLLAFSLKRNWNILTYDRSKPRSDERMKDLACVEGIRVVGMQCVIFSHVMLINIYSFIDNPQYVEKMYDQFGWKAVLNSPLWIQAFFSISGFLTAYTVLISSDTRPITLWKCLMSIVSRWIRLSPVAVFALWFTIAWFPALGAGPQWAWAVAREAADCAERWPYHVLYIHNHLPTGKFCMGHTWYLAVDMQLHVFGIFLLFVLMKWRRAVPLVLAALVAGSMLAAGLVVYWNRLLPIVTAQSPEILRNMFAGSKILTLVYLPMWMNLPGYVGGVATAFLFHHIQVEGLKLNQKKWFNALFHMSLMLGGCVVFLGALFLADEAPPAWAAALYAAFDRTLVTLCFNLFLLGCLSQCTSAFRSALCWRGFHVLGRLSYCVYLVHFIVLRLTVASHTQLGHATLLSLLSLLIASSVLSYIAAIPLCLLVELPAVELWKAVSGEECRPVLPAASAAPAAALTPPLPTHFKPLDLLANVIRQPDV